MNAAAKFCQSFQTLISQLRWRIFPRHSRKVSQFSCTTSSRISFQTRKNVVLLLVSLEKEHPQKGGFPSNTVAFSGFREPKKGQPQKRHTLSPLVAFRGPDPRLRAVARPHRPPGLPNLREPGTGLCFDPPFWGETGSRKAKRNQRSRGLV